MKHLTIILLLTAFLFSSCWSYYPASSEKAYQESVNDIKIGMGIDGYNVTGISLSNGYHDKETYTFSNEAGENVQFTLEVHRGENRGSVFIDEVNVVGCSTSNVQNYHRYCGSYGLPQLTIDKMKKDTEGSEFSIGKTVGAVIGGSFALGIILGLLEVAAMNNL